MLSVSYQIWERSFSDLPKFVSSGNWHSCRPQLSQLPKSRQLWDLKFLELPELPNAWQHYDFRQLSELTTKLFGSIKILSAVGVDIRVDRSFNSYQNPDNFKSWRSCSLQRYLTPGRHYASRQRIFQSYLKIETLCFMLTVWVDNRRFRRYQRKLKRVCFPSTVWVDSCSFQSYFWKEKYY